MSDPDLWVKSGRRHGFELTTNAPMVLAKKLGIPTKQAASLLEERLWADPRFRDLVEKLEYWEPKR